MEASQAIIDRNLNTICAIGDLGELFDHIMIGVGKVVGQCYLWTNGSSANLGLRGQDQWNAVRCIVNSYDVKQLPVAYEPGAVRL